MLVGFPAIRFSTATSLTQPLAHYSDDPRVAVGAGGGCLDIFTLIYPFYPLSPSLWETARYRLKYCLKGPLNPKQPTNQLITGYAEVLSYCEID